MTKRRGIVLTLGLVVAVAVVLAAAFAPRSFTQAVGGGYDPAKTPEENGLKEIHVFLSGVTVDETRELSLAPDDPAAAEVTALLDSQSWRPVYPAQGRQFGMDYTVWVEYLLDDGLGGSVPAAQVFLDGSSIAQAGRLGDLNNNYAMDPALQRQILDLLLAQPYEALEL